MGDTILPLSEYFDLTLLGDYYTNGSYGMNISSTYTKNIINILGTFLLGMKI